MMELTMHPNFLIIGSQKAGTTTLHRVLRQHPQIYMPETKEINFFFKDELYRRGAEFYARYFAEAADEPLRGEASPGYICHPDAPARIHALLPDAKLILTVREPIRRALSQYWDNRRHLSEPHTFAQAVDLYLGDEYVPGQKGYFSRGTYMRYIRNYLAHFPRRQLLVLVFEEMLAEPRAFYRRIFEFLGVDPDFESDDFSQAFNPTTIWKNPFYQILIRKPRYQKYVPAKARRLFFWGKQIRFHVPPIDEGLRKRLEDFYQPWNSELAEFLGRDLTEWKE
ncbi:MAG: sulfotransferase domain-containing protein [Chloroflexi bacterium]|nr:sulfotransferase domain-containing protein [Chloroflexota bacterium]